MSYNVTSKGQVTIPKAVREHLGIKPGTPVDFEVEGGKVVLKRADLEEAKRRIEKVRGRYDFGMSTDEIMKLLRPPE